MFLVALMNVASVSHVCVCMNVCMHVYVCIDGCVCAHMCMQVCMKCREVEIAV